MPRRVGRVGREQDEAVGERCQADELVRQRLAVQHLHIETWSRCDHDFAQAVGEEVVDRRGARHDDDSCRARYQAERHGHGPHLRRLDGDDAGDAGRQRQPAELAAHDHGEDRRHPGQEPLAVSRPGTTGSPAAGRGRGRSDGWSTSRSGSPPVRCR